MLNSPSARNGIIIYLYTTWRNIIERFKNSDVSRSLERLYMGYVQFRADAATYITKRLEMLNRRFRAFAFMTMVSRRCNLLARRR